jgi:S-adenosylmethionine hydrolase
MIALLTDFGDSEYVGVMKGVILSVNEDAKITDLCNFVQPQNIKEAAWILYSSYKYFPKNTVFLCVVDPGVGNKRQCLVIKTKNYFFVGPDIGLMYKAANEDGILEVTALNEKHASRTFHGRDVFAKAAAQIDKAKKIEGKKSNLKVKLDFHLKGREGEIVRIDMFGNIITNLSTLNKPSYIVKTKNFTKKLKFYRTYNEADYNELFVIEGSSNTLEISMKNSDANKKLRVKAGERIKIA